jgi:quercetin 2,3-dioxygenase
VSNLERDPDETVAGGLATVSSGPTRQVLEAREVPLGGTRAMLVRRTLPHRDLPTVGAWCFADDYGPTELAGSPGMHVPPHPHTGLQTVTWLLEGEVHHQDSVGSDQLVRPGQLSLMTAGRGIAHAETSPADAPPRLRGVQLWVALPESDRHTAPAFEHHPELPLVRSGGLSATLIIGELAGERSPATAYTPLMGADVVLDANGTGRLPLDPAFEHAVLALSGDVVVDGAAVADASLVYLGCGRRELTLAAGPAGGRLLLLGGEPFSEQLLMWWNFVGRDHDEIVAFRTEWEASRGGATTRFSPVSGYDGPALPAPEMPSVRLRPRTRH